LVGVEILSSADEQQMLAGMQQSPGFVQQLLISQQELSPSLQQTDALQQAASLSIPNSESQ
jgi:hypothetical protein